MTCVIVNDASCLIDLRKGGVLGVVCDLPYRLVIPLPVQASEVLDLSEAEWQALDEPGMITHDLTLEEVGQAFVVKGCHPGLSANDCFCLVTATVYPGILLTGDALLRRVAARRGMRVHGVLSTSLRPRRLAADHFSVGRSRRGSRTTRCSCPRKKSAPGLSIWRPAGHGGGGEGERAAARALDCSGASADEQCRFWCTWRFAVWARGA